MKINNILNLFAGALLICILAVSCEKKPDIIIPGTSEEKEKPTDPNKKETIFERMQGTYLCTMRASKEDTNFPPDDLYLFIVPSATKSPDSIRIEVRRWFSPIMPHDLGYSVTFGLREEKDGTLRAETKGGFEYAVMAVKGVDPGAVSKMSVTFDKDKMPHFKSEYKMDDYPYVMRVDSKKRLTKKVLPGANSTLPENVPK